MHRVAAHLPAFAFALALSGCTPPCEQWCGATADYVEFCLEFGTTDAWIAAKAGESAGWGTWAAASHDEYASSCKEDMAAQVTGAGDHADALERTCEDESAQYAEWADHGVCSELP